MSEFSRPDTSTDTELVPATEAARQLRTEPYILRQWTRKYSPYLGDEVSGEFPRYNPADLMTLSVVQTLLLQGFSEEQISQHLSLRKNRADSLGWTPQDSTDNQSANHVSPVKPNPTNTDVAVVGPPVAGGQNDAFGVITDNQRAILSNQSTVREIVGVVVQDNFNLKDENRKLRERMLELERVLAEYQRREELRKERLESRLRALETTTSGLQQQIAQLVQIIRKKRRGLFW